MAPIASALIPFPSDSDPKQEHILNPSGFSYHTLDTLATIPGSSAKLIHWYNTQFYGHFPKGPPWYSDIIDAGWEPERIVMGVLDCADDGAPNEFVGMEGLEERARELRETYEEFGGVAGWEYHDAGASDRYDGEVVQNWEWVRRLGEVLLGGYGMKSEI